MISGIWKRLPLAGLGVTTTALGADLQVSEFSGPYFTIQSAINAASDGDVILIDGGYYDEDLTIYEKDLTLTPLNDQLDVIITPGRYAQLGGILRRRPSRLQR